MERICVFLKRIVAGDVSFRGGGRILGKQVGSESKSKRLTRVGLSRENG